MRKKVRYYSDEKTDDFSNFTSNDHKLDEDYSYEETNVIYLFFSFIVYNLLARPLGFIYMKLFQGHSIKGRRNLRGLKTGFFIYGNHTNALPDALIPSLLKFKRKNYVIAGPQTKALKPILPVIKAVGGIPLPDTTSQTKKMMLKLEKITDKGNTVTIYPEAHVWPYYTKIREYAASAFLYPVRTKKPIVVMTSCYKKRLIRKKPRMVTYISKPMFPNLELPKKAQQQELRDYAYNTMVETSKKHSTYEYVKYIKVEPKGNIKTM